MSIIQLPAEPRRCLVTKGNLARGIPHKTMWAKMPLGIEGEEIVVDGLIQLDYPGHRPHLVVLQLEESQPSRRHVHLLRKAGLPVLRLTREDLEREDAEEYNNARLYEAARQGGRVERTWLEAA